MLDRLRDRQPDRSLPRALVYEVCRHTARLTLRLLVRLRGRGAAHVPHSGAVLLAANHESYLDPPAIGSLIPRHVTFVARAGLFRFKPFAGLLSLLNCIPINEDESDVAAIKETLRRLDKGDAVLIFPEGSRSADGSIAPFKRGVALLVKRARCPVVPVAIRGAFHAWPRDRALPRPGRVSIRYGRPIPYDRLMAHGPDAALELIRTEILRLWDDLGPDPTPPA
jgi:1-acyl-sn-glycerol-3-phosphate acyltransferase